MSFTTEIFGVRGHVGPLQECARAVLIFAYGLVLVRLAGRRAFGKWAALDIVVSIIAGSNLSRALTGSAPLFGTLLATTLLMALHWVLAQISVRAPACSWLLEGRSVRLVEAGELLRRVALRHAVSQADLNEALRQNGLQSLDGVGEVTLEPSGKISVLKAS